MYPIYYNIPYKSLIHYKNNYQADLFVEKKFLNFNFQRVYVSNTTYNQKIDGFEIPIINKYNDHDINVFDAECIRENLEILENCISILLSFGKPLKTLNHYWIYEPGLFGNFFFIIIDNDIEHSKLKMLVQSDEFDLTPFKFIEQD